MLTNGSTAMERSFVVAAAFDGGGATPVEVSLARW
jgi:hypothetical protein